MAERTKFVPITEADTQHATFPIADVLPDYVRDRVAVNPTRLSSLAKHWGIHTVQVVPVYEGESRSTPSIVGRNKNTAFAGLRTTRHEVPLFRGKIQRDEPHTEPMAATWASATIEVNMDELSAKIRDNKKLSEGVRTPSAWATLLNRSIKRGLSQAGIKHLITEFSSHHMLSAAATGILIAPIVYMAADIYDFAFGGEGIPLNPLSLTLSYFTANLFQETVGFGLDKFKFGGNDHGYHFSLFEGIQPDRALLMNYYTKTRKVAKALP